MHAYVYIYMHVYTHVYYLLTFDKLSLGLKVISIGRFHLIIVSVGSFHEHVCMYVR